MKRCVFDRVENYVETGEIAGFEIILLWGGYFKTYIFL